jgi:hypothetical protein
VNNATARQTPLPTANTGINGNLSSLLLKSSPGMRKDTKLAAALNAQAAMASLARIYSPADLATINALRAVNSPQSHHQLLIRAQNGSLMHHQNLAVQQHQQLASTAALLNPSLAQAINLNLALGNSGQSHHQSQHGGSQRFMRPTLQQQQQNIINLQNSALLNLANGQSGGQILAGQAQQQLNNQNNALLVAALAAQQQQQNQQQQHNRLNSVSLPSGYS